MASRSLYWPKVLAPNYLCQDWRTYEQTLTPSYLQEDCLHVPGRLRYAMHYDKVAPPRIPSSCPIQAISVLQAPYDLRRECFDNNCRYRRRYINVLKSAAAELHPRPRRPREGTGGSCWTNTREIVTHKGDRFPYISDICRENVGHYSYPDLYLAPDNVYSSEKTPTKPHNRASFIYKNICRPVSYDPEHVYNIDFRKNHLPDFVNYKEQIKGKNWWEYPDPASKQPLISSYVCSKVPVRAKPCCLAGAENTEGRYDFTFCP